LSNQVRNTLLVLLTMTSGCVDAVSFLGLGQVFTAAMTGNTVLFGLAVAHTGGLFAGRYVIALLGFIIGAAIAAVIVRRHQETTGWGRTVTVTLCVELVALLLFAVVCSIFSTLTSVESGFLIAFLAIAMGVQSVAARRIGMSGVTTTVITSTLTGLVESVVWNLGRGKSSLSRDRSEVATKVKETPISSMVLWAAVVVGYAIGAALCGVLESHWHFQAIWLPIVFVSTVIVVATASKVAVERNAENSM
jgi:uncharacterized membrane protein YoaK (UPF0700 family)